LILLSLFLTLVSQILSGLDTFFACPWPHDCLMALLHTWTQQCPLSSHSLPFKAFHPWSSWAPLPILLPTRFVIKKKKRIKPWLSIIPLLNSLALSLYKARKNPKDT
jgi:hypothetical protein